MIIHKKKSKETDLINIVDITHVEVSYFTFEEDIQQVHSNLDRGYVIVGRTLMKGDYGFVYLMELREEFEV